MAIFNCLLPCTCAYIDQIRNSVGSFLRGPSMMNPSNTKRGAADIEVEQITMMGPQGGREDYSGISYHTEACTLITSWMAVINITHNIRTYIYIYIRIFGVSQSLSHSVEFNIQFIYIHILYHQTPASRISSL